MRMINTKWYVKNALMLIYTLSSKKLVLECLTSAKRPTTKIPCGY